MKTAIAILMLLGTLAAAHAFSLGLGNRFGHLGSIAKVGPPTPPPVCIPGEATGEMDFSVCSNIAITAALW